MSKIDDGGAAFPGGEFEPQHGGSNDREPWNAGMTLLDYFAGQAMQALIGQIGGEPATAKDIAELIKTVSKLSYVVAGAMIAARKGGEA